MKILKCDVCGHEADSISEKSFGDIIIRNKTYDICSLCSCKYKQLIANTTEDFLDGKITARCYEY